MFRIETERKAPPLHPEWTRNGEWSQQSETNRKSISNKAESFPRRPGSEHE